MGFGRVSIIVFLALLLPSSVLAAAMFDVDVLPIKSRIMRNESAVYKAMVYNRGTISDSYLISFLDVEWGVDIKPTNANPLSLSPLQKSEIELTLRPSATMPFGARAVSLFVKSLTTGETIKKDLYVDVLPVEIPNLPYTPEIRYNAVLKNDRVDPRSPLEIDLKLENLNRRALPLVKVVVTSDFFTREYSTNLEPRGELGSEKTLEMKFEFPDRQQEPAVDHVVIDIFITTEDNVYSFKTEPLTYQIVPYQDVEKREEKSSGFMWSTTTITFINKGNSPRVESYFVPMSGIKGKFSTATPDPSVAEVNRERQWKWDVRLDVGETQTITYSTSYRPLAFLIILIVVIYLLYLVFRSPVVVRKSARVLQHAHGGISEIKIVLNVRNRSRGRVGEIALIDRVSNIATVIREEQLGTQSPEKVLSHEHKGTIIKWSIDPLEGGDERVVVYKVRSKLPIVGSYLLPSALVRFKTSSGIPRKSRSNNVTLLHEG